MWHIVLAELQSSKFAVLKHTAEDPALKGLQNAAQRRDRRERTLGSSRTDSDQPGEGCRSLESTRLPAIRRSEIPSGYPGRKCPPTQGAPVWRTTLGCVLKPLRGREQALFFCCVRLGTTGTRRSSDGV